MLFRNAELKAIFVVCTWRFIESSFEDNDLIKCTIAQSDANVKGVLSVDVSQFYKNSLKIEIKRIEGQKELDLSCARFYVHENLTTYSNYLKCPKENDKIKTLNVNTSYLESIGGKFYIETVVNGSSRKECLIPKNYKVGPTPPTPSTTGYSGSPTNQQLDKNNGEVITAILSIVAAGVLLYIAGLIVLLILYCYKDKCVFGKKRDNNDNDEENPLNDTATGNSCEENEEKSSPTDDTEDCEEEEDQLDVCGEEEEDQLDVCGEESILNVAERVESYNLSDQSSPEGLTITQDQNEHSASSRKSTVAAQTNKEKRQSKVFDDPVQQQPDVPADVENHPCEVLVHVHVDVRNQHPNDV